MKKMYSTFLLVLALQACYSPKQLYKTGDLNGAVTLAVQRIKAGNTSDKHKLILESAYNEITQSEFQRIGQLKREGNPANWETILQLYNNINIRQNMVQPILPVYIKKEYRNASINLVNIDNELADAKNAAAEFLYNKANGLLRLRNKLAAREAFYLYNRIYGIFSDYRDIRFKIDSASNRGTNLVLVDYKNNTNQILPKAFMDDLRNYNFSELNTEWAVFTNSPNRGKIDLVVVINLRNVVIGPEQIRERNFTETNRIQDGYQYEYDSSGKVKKDANGKEIKFKKFREVFAVVKEVIQDKQGFTEGAYEVMNYNTLENYYTEPFRTDLIFHHEAATFIGDGRALSDRARVNTGHRPIGFPSNEQMLRDGIGTLKANLRTMIKMHQQVFERE